MPRTSHASSTPANVEEINAVLQTRLRQLGVEEVRAVEAARWLDRAGVLKDSNSRPGLPLRNLLRAGQIKGAIQRPPGSHGRWYITRSGPTAGRDGNRVASAGNRRPRQTSPPLGRAADDEQSAARRRRQRAARKYRPQEIKLLLVAEAPPEALDRYFYFEDVPRQDSLFRHVARAILKLEPSRTNKAELLARLRDRGVFLIDLKPDPVNGRPLTAEVPVLIRRVRRLSPAKIIVIKASVFDLVRNPLLDAGLPLVDERVPFPGSGQQRRFEGSFARALRRRPRTHKP